MYGVMHTANCNVDVTARSTQFPVSVLVQAEGSIYYYVVHMLSCYSITDVV